MDPSAILLILVLIMSVVLHEVAHGYAAEALGDPTARLAGRLTLNPIPHIDPIGSILVPTIMILTMGVGFGWAKPVPYNPYNLRDQRWGSAKVAAAGPGTNILLALVFGVAIRIFAPLGTFPDQIITVFTYIVLINLVLAVFNMIPIPPLDGSKVFFSVLPFRYHHVQEAMERNWLIFIALIIFFGWEIISPIVGWLFWLITGLGLF